MLINIIFFLSTIGALRKKLSEKPLQPINNKRRMKGLMFNEQWNYLAWLLIAQSMNQDLFQRNNKRRK